MTTMTTIAAIAKPMVFLDISTSSPHSSAQRTPRPMARIAQRPGYPEGYPGHVSPLYTLASLRTPAAEVQRVLLCLLARLRVDHDLPYRHPAVVAGVGTVLILVPSRWVRGVRGRLCSGHEA